MLKDHDSAAIVAVSDLARARRFYGDTLGLTMEDGGSDAMPVAVYRTGDTRLVVYVSDEAGSNRANAVVWGVGDAIEPIVAALSQKGVTFEEYPIDGARFANGIHHAGAMKMAWFKDPDGNVLHLNNM